MIIAFQFQMKRMSADLTYKNRIASRKQDVLPNTQYLLFALTYFLFVFFIIIIFERNLPDPVTIDIEVLQPDSSASELAITSLILRQSRPRIAGNYENEVLAIKFLTTTINNVMKMAHENYKILFYIMKHSGAFPLKFLDGMTNVYRNVQNVIVGLRYETA